MNVSQPKISYWVIAALGLVWSLMGCLNYIVQTNPETMTQMPEKYQALIASRPAWATAAFAIAVFGGAVGCILLLLRRKVAVHIFVASLLGVTLTMVQAVIFAGFAPQVLVQTGSSLIVAAVLVWVAWAAKARGWLR